VNPGILVLYHSDGSCEPIIRDLLDLGVNALNPLQPEHMDAAAIRRRYGSSLALWGTVGTQAAFATARPGAIRAEVARRIGELGRAGLVLSPAYDVDTPEVERRNLQEFVRAARDLGQAAT
jgi:uroporphyrinogen decarboxylase